MESINDGNLNSTPTVPSKDSLLSQQNTATSGLNDDTKTIITVLLLLFFYPVGVIFMWIWTKWKLWVKLLVMVPSIILVIAIMASIALLAIDPKAQLEKAQKYNSETATEKNSEVGNRFPTMVRNNFLESCIKAGGEQAYCDCALKYIEDRMTVQEFAKAEDEYTKDPSKTSIFNEATYACLDTLKK